MIIKGHIKIANASFGGVGVAVSDVAVFSIENQVKPTIWIENTATANFVFNIYYAPTIKGPWAANTSTITLTKAGEPYWKEVSASINAIKITGSCTITVSAGTFNIHSIAKEFYNG